MHESAFDLFAAGRCIHLGDSRKKRSIELNRCLGYFYLIDLLSEALNLSRAIRVADFNLIGWTYVEKRAHTYNGSNRPTIFKIIIVLCREIYLHIPFYDFSFVQHSFFLFQFFLPYLSCDVCVCVSMSILPSIFVTELRFFLLPRPLDAHKTFFLVVYIR